MDQSNCASQDRKRPMACVCYAYLNCPMGGWDVNVEENMGCNNIIRGMNREKSLNPVFLFKY